jgi:hypothetical protein
MQCNHHSIVFMINTRSLLSVGLHNPHFRKQILAQLLMERPLILHIDTGIVYELILPMVADVNTKGKHRSLLL